MPKPGLLISGLQLCLAHYCDIHGPTPLMVTEGLPTSCSICVEEPNSNHGSPKAQASPSHASDANTASIVTDALRDLNIARNSSTLATQQDHTPRRNSTLQPSGASLSHPSSTSALETPPGSPATQPLHRDSSFRRTYDDTVTKKQGPCDNCAMTLPPHLRQTIGPRGPTLRSRAPAEGVFGTGYQASPPNSRSSSDTDGDQDSTIRRRTRTNMPSISSRTTSCSSTSSSSERVSYHVHYLDYTSTHEPLLANSFSLLRASCLRTLSFETLPRAPSTASATSPQSSSGSAFVTTQSAGSAVSGGPIFFGDALAGYTTAYIFRIPDVHARGHKRIYAFVALSTHKERLAMKTFAIISTAFRELATWIQQLAEAEAERSAESSAIGIGTMGGPSGNIGAGGILPQPKQASAFDPPAIDRGGSSFLTGGSGFTRRMAGGARASAPKARGLAELVGQPDFFVDLHGRFVRLLFEVGVTLGI